MLINIYIIIITHKKHWTAYILNQMQGDTSTRATRHKRTDTLTRLCAQSHITYKPAL